MDTRRTILWVVFSVSLFLLWDNWQRYHNKPSFFGMPATTQASQNAAPAKPAGGDVPAAGAVTAAVPKGGEQGGAGAAPAAASAAVPAATAATQGERVTIQTDLMKVDLNSAGAQVERAELLRINDNVDASKRMVLLDSDPKKLYLAQSGLIGGAAGAVLPNHRTVFAVQPGPRALEAGQDKLEVSMAAESGGVKLVKTFVFHRGSYLIDVRHDIVNTADAPLAAQLYLQLVRNGDEPAGSSHFYSTFTGAAVYTDAEKFQKQSFSDIEKNKINHATKAADGWIAIIQHYFVSAWIPPEKIAREIYTEKVDTNLYRVGNKLALPQVAPGATLTENARLYVGPQEERTLEGIAPGLELVRDYGWFTIFAKPLFWLLEKLNHLFGNWGWAIVGLTVLIKLAFFPLSAASYKSMARMKVVAPRMKALQERFKDDRAKLNQAMMELYRTEKINPLGGCLPILIQMPVFIALYWTLLASVEMRNAPWIGWVHDLTAPDPFYILPVIMMVSMLVQYKLNPAPPDPMQAKMMLIMPLVFGVMFFFFPAGLVLYWVVNNILSIAQQWYITRKLGVKVELTGGGS